MCGLVLPFQGRARNNPSLFSWNLIRSLERMAERFQQEHAAEGDAPAKGAATAPTASRIQPWFRRDWFLGLVLVLAAILAYSPVWWAGFVWDDDWHVTTNRFVVGPLGWKELWTTLSVWRSFPLVITAFRGEYALWGLAPLPYHLVNVFEHAACAVLLWRVLRACMFRGHGWVRRSGLCIRCRSNRWRGFPR